mmetsp:Transcript_41716/g.50798  ORF Transcript_41716/g.50798 Transcript_41716/m.50798 type:complete len:525 (+) Transcript_41716:213-1787(+)
MGKKSKRNRSKTTEPSEVDDTVTAENTTPSKTNAPPANRQTNNNEPETISNLRFEDPFPDQYEEEDVVSENDDDDDDGGDDEMMDDGDDDAAAATTPTPWTPWGCSGAEKLEIDPSAYKMHHALTPEWPSLTFSFLKDDLGENRTRFPHSLTAVIGSQADKVDRNKITVMKLSDLGRMDRSDEDDSDSDDSDSDDDDEEEKENDDVETEPVLEYYSMKHLGGVNRLRTWGNIVSVWGDRGTVSLYDVTGTVDKLHGRKSNERDSGGSSGAFFTYSGHNGEGYAMDWSRVKQGHLATGDCHGGLHLWFPSESIANDITSTSDRRPQWDQSSFVVEKSYQSDQSVEDIQWSPSEGTVFATGECQGRIKIYDTRCQGKFMLNCLAHDNNSDVNVISWNGSVTNLLASGSDDGVFSVWDLRNFSSTPAKPLARFTPHDKPITSLEWHPTDESMIVVSDDDATYIYDLSIEAEEDEVMQVNQEKSIPPQMLFMHCGSTLTKEVHWHPQITSMIMTTAWSGFSAFIPVNL